MNSVLLNHRLGVVPDQPLLEIIMEIEHTHIGDIFHENGRDEYNLATGVDCDFVDYMVGQ